MAKFWEDFKFGLAFGLGLIVCLFIARIIAAAFSGGFRFPW
jgi:hypothetical protein